MLVQLAVVISRAAVPGACAPRRYGIRVTAGGGRTVAARGERQRTPQNATQSQYTQTPRPLPSPPGRGGTLRRPVGAIPPRN
eukprot:4738642-Prymnesium_polylepis.2